nr:uncharacterized protein LOC115852653 [Globicephala melas]
MAPKARLHPQRRRGRLPQLPHTCCGRWSTTLQARPPRRPSPHHTHSCASGSSGLIPRCNRFPTLGPRRLHQTRIALGITSLPRKAGSTDRPRRKMSISGGKPSTKGRTTAQDTGVRRDTPPPKQPHESPVPVAGPPDHRSRCPGTLFASSCAFPDTCKRALCTCRLSPQVQATHLRRHLWAEGHIPLRLLCGPHRAGARTRFPGSFAS